MFDSPSECEAQTSVLKTIGTDSTILGALKRNQKVLQEHLDDCTKAIEALEENPNLAKVLELINKARR